MIMVVMATTMKHYETMMVTAVIINNEEVVDKAHFSRPSVIY